MDDDFNPVRGHIRSADFRRVSHGLFLPVIEGADPGREWLRDLSAWQAVLPPSAVFTGLTAARLAGWWIPSLPDWVPIFAAVEPGDPRPQRSGLLVSRLERAPGHEAWQARCFPVDRPTEILLRCARDLDLLDMVPLVESALRTGSVSRAELDEFCLLPRPGVRMLRRAIALADVRSESPWETALRLFLLVLDLDVEVQPEILDEAGVFVARADLRVRGTTLLFEYDGASHRSRRSQEKDLRRQRRLMETGQQRRGYTASDLHRHPAVAMGEIDRLLGRTSDLRRLRTWKSLVDRSTYSVMGRDRLRTRWAVQMGVFSVR